MSSQKQKHAKRCTRKFAIAIIASRVNFPWQGVAVVVQNLAIALQRRAERASVTEMFDVSVCATTLRL